MDKRRENYSTCSENNYRVRDQQEGRHGKTFLGRGDSSAAVGFTWPPRSYTCSFCKREFRSAQALGGHMNVHRRDRARLRQCSPPWDNPAPLYPNTNILPNLNMPPPSFPRDDKPSPPVLYSFSSLISPLAPPLSCSSSSSSFLLGSTEERRDGGVMRQETEVMKLGFDDLNCSLDLELRLWYT